MPKISEVLPFVYKPHIHAKRRRSHRRGVFVRGCHAVSLVLPVKWSRILPHRHTTTRYEDGSTSEVVDGWTNTHEHRNPSEFWTGVITFTVGPDKSLVHVPDYQTEDFRLKEAHTWIRVHVAPRCALSTPHGANSGPAHPDKLLDVRRTTCYLPSGEETILEDNWKVMGHRVLPMQWTGTTEFEEDVELGIELPSLQGRLAKRLTLPSEATQQEIELHKLTHVPHRPWCIICVRAKGRYTHHRRQGLRSPVVQIDYYFAGTQRELNRTLLTACDVATGLVMCMAVPSKEVSHYHVASAKSFLVEPGRAGAILHGDNEQATRALMAQVCTYMPGLIKRFAPTYSSQSLGSVGQAQRNLYDQIRALRFWRKTTRHPSPLTMSSYHGYHYTRHGYLIATRSTTMARLATRGH